MPPKVHAILRGFRRMNLDASLDDLGEVSSAGSLARLDDNIILIHVAPYLGLHDSLALANTSRHYRNLLLHHTMGNNTIPAGRWLIHTFPEGALAAIKHIEIGLPTHYTDILSVLWGAGLPALRSLTIFCGMGGSHYLPFVGAQGLRRIRTLTVGSTTASDFFSHPQSAGTLRYLRSLTIQGETDRLGRSRFPVPGPLLRALGPVSQLTTLTMTSDRDTHCPDYHASALALLTNLSLWSATPPRLTLVRLSFHTGWHHERNGPSLIVAASRSSLTHPRYAWRLGRAPFSASHYFDIPLWVPGCDPNCFLLTQKELDEIIEMNDTTWHRARLTNFFADPVIVSGTKLGHVGMLGTSLQGLEFDMLRHRISPTHFPHSVTSIALRYMADSAPTADPMPWLQSTAVNLKSIELLTGFERWFNASKFPRIHELFELPVMPNLTTLRIDSRLLLEAGEHRKCGWSTESHKAARYGVSWIPAVARLRLEGWSGCVGCWNDCAEGTMRHFVENGAGGAGVVTVRGMVTVRGRFNPNFGKQQMGFGEMWEVAFMSPGRNHFE